MRPKLISHIKRFFIASYQFMVANVYDRDLDRFLTNTDRFFKVVQWVFFSALIESVAASQHSRLMELLAAVINTILIVLVLKLVSATVYRIVENFERFTPSKRIPILFPAIATVVISIGLIAGGIGLFVRLNMLFLLIQPHH